VTGPAAADIIETYRQSATMGGAERVSGSPAGLGHVHLGLIGRQALYEYYFFGDSVPDGGPYVSSYDREPYMAASAPS